MKYDMQQAIRFNTKASSRIWKHHELPLPFVDLVAHSEAFAEATAHAQAAAGLLVDGCFGYKTLAALRSIGSASPGGMLGTSANVPGAAKSKLMTETKNFDELEIDNETYKASNFRKRTKKPICILLHDSVTASAKACFRVLEQKKYSTHYMIDENGDVFECADPEKQTTFHASAFNDNSIGIDMITLLSPSKIEKDNAPNRARRKRLIDREWSAHKSGKVIDYTEAQKKALSLLVRHLCERFDIRNAAPDVLTGYGEKLKVEAKEYRGIIAHGQTSSKRWDGLLAVEVLHQDGSGVA